MKKKTIKICKTEKNIVSLPTFDIGELARSNREIKYGDQNTSKIFN
jgi:hypothetical protein